jgi:hypothetical protein
MISNLHAFLQTHGLLPLLKDWQSLIAGLLGLLAGLVAFVGALIAAYRQVRTMRRTAAAQVATMQAQIADLQAEREKTDERRRSVVKWAVRAEGQWLGITAAALKLRALPSRPQPAARSKEQLVIASSPLLRGEREDIALLDDRTREPLEEVAETLNDYNSRITMAALPDGLHPLIDQEVLDLVDRLARLAVDLQS